jgi:hypothetical protein
VKLIEVFRPVTRRNGEAEQRPFGQWDGMRHRVLNSSEAEILCHCRRLVTKMYVPKARPKSPLVQK